MKRLLSLPCALSSPAQARRAVVDVLAPLHVDAERVAAAQAVVSELVANAVMHGDSEVDVFLRTEDDSLRIEVVDYGGGVPTMLRPSADADRGRGLLVVEGLSAGWGVLRRQGCKLVWAEVALEADREEGLVRSGAGRNGEE